MPPLFRIRINLKVLTPFRITFPFLVRTWAVASLTSRWSGVSLKWAYFPLPGFITAFFFRSSCLWWWFLFSVYIQALGNRAYPCIEGFVANELLHGILDLSRCCLRCIQRSNKEEHCAPTPIPIASLAYKHSFTLGCTPDWTLKTLLRMPDTRYYSIW